MALRASQKAACFCIPLLRRRRGRLLSLRLPRLPAPQGLGQVHNLRHSIGVREDTIQFFIELSQDKHPR